MTSKKLYLMSLGCTKNLVDSEVMLGKLQDYEITQEPQSADVLIVNTCGFIESAKQESIQSIFEMSQARKNGALLVVSGCLSQRYYDELKSQIPEIDIITGVGDYDKIDKMIAARKGQKSQNVFLASEKDERVITNSSFHAYIKLSEGCNQNCSFCAIPSFKGRLHSRTLDSVLKELSNLHAKGYKDFSLISQDTSSFLRDLGQKDGLAQLVREIDGLRLDISVRILYLYPSTTNEHLIDTIATSKCVLPYFDMPLQHISSSMLKIMNRGSSAKYHRDLINLMNGVKDRFLRTSFIVGHPGESESDFEELLEFVEASNFDRINLFEFSPQEGTASFDMQNVEKRVINARMKKLAKAVARAQARSFENLAGRKIQVVLNGKSEVSEYFYSARARLWAPEIDGEILINEIDESLDSESVGNLSQGSYMCEITQVENNKDGNFVFGKLLGRDRF